LGLEIRQALSQTTDPWFEFLFFDEAFGVAIDQTSDTATHFNNPNLKGSEVLTFLAGSLQATLIFLFEALGLFQQRTDLMPDQLVQDIGPYLYIITDSLSAKTIGIGADTAVVGIVAHLALGRFSADRFAIVGILAVGTDEQALEEVTGAALALPRPFSVFFQLQLNGVE
jgi:hypothetical protein